MKLLDPYQLEGVRWLAARPHAGLGDDPGLGKSAQAIRAAAAVGAHHIGVVCPATARTNWQRQFDQWWIGGSHDLQIDSYQKVAAGVFDAREFDVLILDEGHMLKSPGARRTKTIYGAYCAGGGLVARSNYVWPMSGTFMPNSDPMEMYPHIRALRPDLIQHHGRVMNQAEYLRTFCNFTVTPYGPKVVGIKNIEDFRRILREFVLRRTEREVQKQLPEIVWSHETVDDAEAASILAAIEDTPEVRDLRHHLETDGDYHAYERLSLSATRRIISELKARTVGPVLAEELDRRTGKVVVFAHHHAAINRLHSEMSRHGCVQITGETPAHKRQEAIDRFQNSPDVRVFLGQIDSCGTAIELTAANHVEFLESSWVPQLNYQAVKRCHRRGQINTVFARIWGLAGSVDDLIAGVCTRKLQQFKRLEEQETK